MKRLFAGLLALALAVPMAACNGQGDASSSAPASSAPSSASEASSAASQAASSEAAVPEISFPVGKPIEDREDVAQRVADALNGAGKYANNPVATIETSEGTVKIRLFPQEAPRTVENFVTHAKDGYYDGLDFHRVINDFMIQGGDPKGDGTGGESIWGGGFEDEFSDVLHNFRGALSMAHSEMPSSNGSQFFIVQSKSPLPESQREGVLLTMYMQRELNNANVTLLQAMKDNKTAGELDQLTEELNGALQEKQAAGVPQWFRDGLTPVLDRYGAEGGAYYLDYVHTVFGYVIEGMDVVDAIAALDSGEVNAAGQPTGKPSRPVTIEKITVEEP